MNDFLSALNYLTQLSYGVASNGDYMELADCFDVRYFEGIEREYYGATSQAEHAMLFALLRYLWHGDSVKIAQVVSVPATGEAWAFVATVQERRLLAKLTDIKRVKAALNFIAMSCGRSLTTRRVTTMHVEELKTLPEPYIAS